MKAYLLASVLLLSAAPGAAQSSPEDNDKRPVSAHFYELTPLKPPADFAAGLKVPRGYRATVWATGLGNARVIAVAPDGAVYISRRSEADIIRLVDADRDGRADGPPTVVVNRPGLHGLTIHAGKLYFMTAREVFRAALRPDGGIGTVETLIDDLPDAGQHLNRTLAVGPDDMLYISSGSTCNACDESSQENATLLRASLDGKTRSIWASGLRNTIGFGWHPATGELWGWDQGIDWLGNDFQREEVNRIERGARYGWPYIFENGQRNPQDEPPGLTAADWAAASKNPALLHVAHSAGMQWAFHPGGGFGPDVAGDAFVALRGSWNRKPASGYELARVRFNAAGQPVRIESFVSGFMSRDGTGQYGRPCGVAVLRDGSILLTDDANGIVYRIAYDGATGQAAPYQPPAAPMLRQAALGSGVPLALQRPETRARTSTPVAVSAAAFRANGAIPREHSEYGVGISPELSWTSVAGAQSYALIMEDPDATAPKPFVHWLVWNIPAATSRLPAGLQERDRLSGGPLEGIMQGATSRGSVGWFGPRPPKGDRPHRYRFQLLALDRTLALPLGATRDQLLAAANGHVLATGELTGTFAEPAGGPNP